MDLFSFNNLPSHSSKELYDTHARSGAWKVVIDKVLNEKSGMKVAFKAQIKKLKQKLHHKDVFSSVYRL